MNRFHRQADEHSRVSSRAEQAKLAAFWRKVRLLLEEEKTEEDEQTLE
jgi:hypothetical protein